MAEHRLQPAAPPELPHRQRHGGAPRAQHQRPLKRFLVAGLLLVAGRADAHDPFEITTDARLRPDGLRVTIGISQRTAGKACAAVGGARPDVTATFETQRQAWEACARDLLRISAADVVLQPREARAGLTREGDIESVLGYPRPADARGVLTFRAVFLESFTDPTYGVVLTVTGEKSFLGQQLLRPDASSATISLDPAAAAGAPMPTFGQYLRLGVEHILTGTDHLLFLLGLLVVCRRFRTVAAIVTCFTVAHSITLALAALGIVTLSSRIVEPLIAASIVFIGVENLVRGDEPKGRWVLTFAFGLVHGLGFAGALREIGLGRDGAPIAAPLVAFNLGVELGQLAVAIPLLAVLWKLRTLLAFSRWGAKVVSTIVAIAGTVWLIQRLVA